MIAFSWRQFRTQALIGAAGLIVLGVILLITGPNLVHVYDVAVAQCRASGGGGVGGCINPVATDDGRLQTLALALVLIVPVIIGMFWGAPLLAANSRRGRSASPGHRASAVCAGSWSNSGLSAWPVRS